MHQLPDYMAEAITERLATYYQAHVEWFLRERQFGGYAIIAIDGRLEVCVGIVNSALNGISWSNRFGGE